MLFQPVRNGRRIFWKRLTPPSQSVELIRVDNSVNNGTMERTTTHHSLSGRWSLVLQQNPSHLSYFSVWTNVCTWHINNDHKCMVFYEELCETVLWGIHCSLLSIKLGPLFVHIAYLLKTILNLYRIMFGLNNCKEAKSFACACNIVQYECDECDV